MLAFVLWYVMFVRPPLNFWLLMSISTSVLAIISLMLRFPPIEPEELNWKHFWIGALSAIVLYIVFIVGNRVSGLFIPGKASQLAEIYNRRQSLPYSIVAMLLFFPISVGEELFWRGLVQRVATIRWGWRNGFLFTVFFYTAVHVVTGNIVLIEAAFVCGFFWGLLYWRTNSIVPCLISHMLWDPLVMVLLPIY